jgi:hypothetical protein
MVFASIILSVVMMAGAAPPLAAARMAPPDVHAVIQVRGGLAGKSAGMRTLGAGLRSLVDSIGAGERWGAAANLAELSPEALLQRCAGRDASLVVRAGGRGESGGWVLALEMEGREACDLLKSLGARMSGGARFEVPQLGVVGRVCGNWLLVSDRAENPLLRDMLRIASEADAPNFAQTLPQGWDRDDSSAVTVALRHDRMAQGVSVWSIRDDGPRVRVQLRAALQDRPLGTPLEGVEPIVDPDALPEDTIACWMQSMPARLVPRTWCADGADCEAIAAVDRTRGPRMAVLIGPRRDGEGAFAAAVAVELRDAQAGTRAHDAMLDQAAAALARLEGRPLPCRIDRARLPIEAVRHCDERGMAESTFGAFECLGTSELHARTVTTAQGGWRVYASDVPWLDQVVAVIEDQPIARSVSAPVQWTRAGCADGGALAAGLDRWARERLRHGGCAKTLEVLAGVVRNAGRVTWRMQEPEPGVYQAEIDLLPVDASAFEGSAIAEAASQP